MGSKLLNHKNIPLIYIGVIVVIAFLNEMGFSIESKVADFIIYIVVGILAIQAIRSASYQSLGSRRLAFFALILSISLFILNNDIVLSLIVFISLIVYLFWIISKDGSNFSRTIAFLFGLFTLGINIILILLNYFIPAINADNQRIISPNKQFVLINRYVDTGATGGDVVVDVQKKFYFVK